MAAIAASVVPEELWNEDKVQEAIELWKLTPEDAKKLRAIQQNLHKDIGPHPWNDPHVVLAFAEAHGFKTAEKRFRKMMQWRQRNNIDNLLKEYVPHPLLMDNSPVAFLKDYDNDGDPIYLERGGACDLKGLLKRFSKEEVMKHAVWLREVQSSGLWFEEYEKRQGRLVKDITVIYDLKGLCPRHLHPNVIGWFQRFMQITEDYYPGPVKRVIVIRSPHIFRKAWALVRNFFKEEDREKMIFANSDYLTELAKYMNIDILPPCINPNGHGETAVGMPKRMEGGKIPSHIGKGGAGYVSPYYHSTTENYNDTNQTQRQQQSTGNGQEVEVCSTSTDEEEVVEVGIEVEEKETTTITTCEGKATVVVVVENTSKTVAATC